jgi:uroporphyrinogen-III decarboxylase
MTCRERVEVALKGGKPDRVPIVPIYDMGYVMRSIGQDVREYCTHNAAGRLQAIEESFLRHDVDGIFVHGGANDGWAKTHTVEKHADYWMVTNKDSGHQYRLQPDGWIARADGTKIPRPPSHGGVSKVQTEDDLRRLAPKIPTEESLEASGRFGPLKYLCQKYPDRHFSFQTGTPMVPAVDLCGGFVEGLLTLATDRDLFRKLLAHYAKVESAYMLPGRKAGAQSTWFTSYYMAADSISPRDYAELVFPYELEVCQAAKDAGLFVLNWFLGDLMPILDKVMELPLDALVLEQGRKSYEIDPVEIRERVGPKFCLFGFGFENDYCTFNRERLSDEFRRQFEGAGKDGAFIAGTPIMPPNANPDAVDFYFAEVRRIGRYWNPD